MIRDIVFRPKPTNSNARSLMIASAVGAVAFTVISHTMDKYKGIVGLVALIFLVVAVYVYTKYVGTGYCYQVMAGDTPLFLVSQRIGKRETTLCRVELRSIVSVAVMTAAEYKAHKTEVGYSKYYYTPTLGPEHVVMITLRSRYERAEVVIEAGEELAALISEYSKEAREAYSDEDDE